MRIFTFASRVLGPVAVTLATLVVLAPSTSYAAPAPAPATKRISHRVLPAPLPKLEVLPPLPPVARDLTAITTISSAPLPDWTTSAGSASGANAASSAGSAANEALPPLPPGHAASTATAPAGADVVSAPDSVREVSASGFVLQLGGGALAPTQSFTAGMRTLGPAASIELRSGYYATPHFAVLVGVRGSFGHQLPGAGASADGYSFQVPVLFQLAAKDRTRGVYFDFGVGLGTTYGGSAGSGVKYTLTSPVEGKLGLGYRIGASGARSAVSLDLNLGMDIGAIDDIELEASDGTTLSGKGDRPVHVVMALSALLHFSL